MGFVKCHLLGQSDYHISLQRDWELIVETKQVRDILLTNNTISLWLNLDICQGSWFEKRLHVVAELINEINFIRVKRLDFYGSSKSRIGWVLNIQNIQYNLLLGIQIRGQLYFLSGG